MKGNRRTSCVYNLYKAMSQAYLLLLTLYCPCVRQYPSGKPSILYSQCMGMNVWHGGLHLNASLMYFSPSEHFTTFPVKGANIIKCKEGKNSLQNLSTQIIY